ncbi:hypothetical protein ETD86_34760 [Nonomuraea turkmeniaca]|uniref:Uncharacterized protein n=1 Tax=Nonomuraea turkmeniaca TaxID=103838 RepID=A0A5S4F6D7_9ACTN|nr:hypothetical protein [Nonomuraea turkmeniaca]TMR11733.1 hypothetical protein ETD86_34760 [Nonomuraea turkmeniaca]
MNEPGNAVEGMLTLLAIEPTLLPPAPERADGRHIEHRRRDEIHDCLRCGQRAMVAYIARSMVADPDPGPRWLDLCPACDYWLRTNLPEEWRP